MSHNGKNTNLDVNQHADTAVPPREIVFYHSNAARRPPLFSISIFVVGNYSDRQ